MRTIDQLTRSAHRVIDEAWKLSPVALAPLFSGGHDSTVACHVSSRHRRFAGDVWHIDTGIGARATRRHVEETASALGWRLRVLKSKSTYEMLVANFGFPGPGSHCWAYARLKERCIRELVKQDRTALVTGCRRHESVRRMGNTEPVKHGEYRKDGQHREKNRVWTAPCYDWTDGEQAAYMEEFDLPRNPLKAKLGVSGECFCGAFAKPGELDAIRRHAPDVAAEIDRLTPLALAAGKPCVWGTRPAGRRKGVVVAETGPLCSSCDIRAALAGIEIKESL